MKEENSLITRLRSLGAIPFVRTNVPQTMLSWGCSNPIYGLTVHPLDSTRTPGGSSGGEACLISTGGSPFGIGTDIGGSLRVPSHFCGVTTLKPSSGRFKTTGSRASMPGQPKIALTAGFITKDVATLTFLHQQMWTAQYFNRVPQCVPLPFNHSNGERVPLRIGYYMEDGWFPTTPACKRAVIKAKQILESAGHILVPFQIPDPERAVRLFAKCLYIDNGTHWLDSLKNEDVDPILSDNYKRLSRPLWIRWIKSRIMAFYNPKAAMLVDSYVKGICDLRATFEETDAYGKEFIAYWMQLKLDAVLGIVYPFPAVTHEAQSKLRSSLGTTIYNLLDLPAGVVPIDKVTKEDEDKMIDYPTGDPTLMLVRQAMVGTVGLPVGVQVIGLPFQDEVCLQLMKVIEDGR